MNILVIGAGAIGGYVGGKLASQHAVTLVGRRPLVEAVQARGLRLIEPETESLVKAVAAVDSLEAAFQQDACFDLALFCVKTYDTRRTLDQAQPYAARIERVLSLQNGVASEEVLGETFGREKIVAGTILNPISAPEAGVVRLEKRKGGIGVAALGQRPIQVIAGALRVTALPVRRYADYRSMKWSKLILNLIGNATSAILDMTTLESFADQRVFRIEIAALREAVAVMRAQSIRPVDLPGYPVGLLVLGLRFAPIPLLRQIMQPMIRSGRGDKPPSLLMDLRYGKSQSEIDELNGAIVRAGRATGVQTPVNEALVNTLQDLVAGRADRSAWRHQIDRLVALTGT